MPKQKIATVIFSPSGIRGEVPIGTDILSAAQLLGADLDTACGGIGNCARCVVEIAEGDFPKYGISSGQTHLTPVASAEPQQIDAEGIAAGKRLGCQTRILDDVLVNVPEVSQTHRQVVRKAASRVEIVAKPAISWYTVQVPEPKLHEPSGDLERLYDAIEFETGWQNLSVDPLVLTELQPALRQGDWTVTVAISEQQRLLALWPGTVADIYGVVVDIGSTTIAAHLCHLVSGEVLASDGMMNPQIRFGEDLMSRVSYVMMNPGGDAEMTEVVREGINELITRLTESAQVSVEHVLDIVLVGNPVMHHLFLGINPVELGGAPFALATQGALNLRAHDVGITLNRGATAYLLPCIAGHVGADAAAVTLAEAPHKAEGMTLLVDIGTNAEIVVGNRTRLLAASSPTGPAFEGAQIKHGQRAAPGAIERIRIDKLSYEPRFQVIGSELWSDQPGFEESLGTIKVTGICGSAIIEGVAELFLAGLLHADGLFDDSKLTATPRLRRDDKTLEYVLYDLGTEITITQNDIRAIQLAKATLYASVELLMDKIGISSLDEVRLAGAFGMHIDPKYAMVLGMIPDCDLDKVRAVGNAAGKGAQLALMSVAARREIETLVRRVEKIETATEAKFQDYFVAAMSIPHRDAAYTKLRQSVDLPALSASTGASTTRRSSRRRRSSRGGSPNKSR